MERMRVMVTGSSGFIGSHIVDLLVQRGYQVNGIDLNTLPSYRTIPPYEFDNCDICNRSDFVEIVHKWAPQIIVHLAARIDLDGQKIEDYSANIEGVENLIDAIQCTPSVKRCIVTSSQLVCKIGYIPQGPEDYQPTTFYGQSKVRTEQIIRQQDGGGVEWCIVRPTTIWGPGMSNHYQRLFRTILNGTYFHVGQSDLFKSYGFVGNTAHQYLKLIEAPTDQIYRQVFYLADYQPLSLQAWINSFQRELQTKPIRTIPLPIARAVANLGDIINYLGFRSFPFNSFRLNNILTQYQFDMSLTKQVCGVLPFTMDQGVILTAAWIREKLSNAA